MNVAMIEALFINAARKASERYESEMEILRAERDRRLSELRAALQEKDT